MHISFSLYLFCLLWRTIHVFNLRFKIFSSTPQFICSSHFTMSNPSTIAIPQIIIIPMTPITSHSSLTNDLESHTSTTVLCSNLAGAHSFMDRDLDQISPRPLFVPTLYIERSESIARYRNMNWDVVQKPRFALRTGRQVYLKDFGVAVLKEVESEGPITEWRFFSCNDLEGYPLAEVIVKRDWCEGWSLKEWMAFVWKSLFCL